MSFVSDCVSALHGIIEEQAADDVLPRLYFLAQKHISSEGDDGLGATSEEELSITHKSRVLWEALHAIRLDAKSSERLMGADELLALLENVLMYDTSASSNSPLVERSTTGQPLLDSADLARKLSKAELKAARKTNEDAEWILLSKAAIVVYGLVVARLMQSAIPLTDHLHYWTDLTANRTSLTLYGVQSMPARLASYTATSLHGTIGYGHYPRMMLQFRKSASLSSLLTNVQAFRAVIRNEARWKRNRVESFRNVLASCVGMVVEKAMIVPPGETNSQSLRKSFIDGIFVLSNVLESMNTIMVSPSFTSSTATGDINVWSSTEINQKLLAIGARSTPNIELNDMYAKMASVLEGLRRHVELRESFLKTFSRPGWLMTCWLPVAMGLIVSTNASSLVWRRRADIFNWLGNIRETVLRFSKDWIMEPCIKIFRTIRHEENLSLLSGAESLSTDLQSLENMVADFAQDRHRLTPEGLQTLSSNVRRGDLSIVLRTYEDNIKSPIRNAVSGDLIRIMLIQVQKAKVDLEAAMQALDKLLRSNELNFAFLAVVPSMLLTVALYKMAAAVLRRTFRGKSSNAKELSKKALRDVEKILVQCMSAQNKPLPYNVYGMLLVEVHSLRLLSRKVVPALQHLIYLEDLRDLEDYHRDVPQKLQIIHRIYRTYGFLAA